MAYDFSQVKLLVVDDVQPMLALTVNILKRFGFQDVDGAKNVEEASKLFLKHNHDLVLTDWFMEPYDGLELVERIRKADTADKFVPIILMTGYADRLRVEMARDSGVTEFLIKPFTVKDLYARIVQVIEKPRPYIQSEQFFGPDRRRRKIDEYKGDDRRTRDTEDQ
ncbi:MAG: response regulator [Micavibrio aeruginosavorus]|uniref:Response regulator n=1 Tax=Micavibrio aeruginosavorus TaxID=349221 RepID=A0A2W5BKV6_9BACT|nr:MAG: response regulator [Micavibrio aeruginosavorus]